jgi:hypothetical protein
MFFLEASITKPALSVIDENLERFVPFKYNLLLSIGQDSAACCVVDLKNQNYAAIEQVNFMNNQSIENSFDLFENYFRESIFAKIKYKAVTAIIASEFFTIVPQALFETGAAESILRFNTNLNFEAAILSNQVNSVESTVIQAVPVNIKKGFEKLFGEVKLLHHTEPLIIESMTQFKNSNEKTLLAHIQNGHFELMAIANHKMIFFNSFKFVTTEDVAYYILLVCETLKLNPEEITLKLCGEIEKKSAIYALLYKYIRNIEFLNSHRTFKYSGGFSPLPSHFFFNLINTAHCV